MAEYLHSRIRDALADCTAEWRSAPPDPLEAVVSFRHLLGQSANRYTTYLSTAITAGGYVRDKLLAKQDVVAGNTEAALLYADHLHRQQLIKLEESVDAVALGYIPGWSQSDYMWFWLPILTRPDLTPANIRTIHSTVTTFEASHDMSQFNNPDLTHQQRRPIYHALGNAFLRATRSMNRQPVQQTIQLIDGQLSLGGDVERQVSHAENISVLLPAYGGNPEKFAQSLTHPKLAQHLGRLAELGAVFVQRHTTPGHFSLVSEQPA